MQAISPTAFLAVLVWGAIAPFTKYSLETIPTLAFMAIRMSVAAVAVFVLLAARRKPLGIERDDLPKFLLAGTVLFALSTLLFTGGLSQTTVANMSFCRRPVHCWGRCIVGFTGTSAPTVVRWWPC